MLKSFGEMADEMESMLVEFNTKDWLCWTRVTGDLHWEPLNGFVVPAGYQVSIFFNKKEIVLEKVEDEEIWEGETGIFGQKIKEIKKCVCKITYCSNGKKQKQGREEE